MRKILLIVLIVTSVSCNTDNSKSITISLEEWNSLTLNSILNECRLDSAIIQNYNPPLKIEASVINTFNEHVDFYLQQRSELIPVLTDLMQSNSILKLYEVHSYNTKYIVQTEKLGFYELKLESGSNYTLLPTELNEIWFEDDQSCIVNVKRTMREMILGSKLIDDGNRVKVELKSITLNE